MGIAVVTSAWSNYGRYLGEWARSVAKQSPVPDQVVIAEFGDCTRQANLAALALRRRGIKTSVVSEPYAGMGSARNTAVAAAGTEWVMHLDADDLLLPGTLARVGRLMDDHDVISLGAKYKSGKERCFPDVSREWILTGRLGCFSCSPYRRSLWEQSPYQTQNDYVDSLLWVGFAHLGARFVGMRRPGFVYRQHHDSFKRSLTPEHLAAAKDQLRRAIRKP